MNASGIGMLLLQPIPFDQLTLTVRLFTPVGECLKCMTIVTVDKTKLN